MSSKNSLGLFGALGALFLLLAGLAVGAFAAQSFGLIESLPFLGTEAAKQTFFYALCGLPGAAALCGFLSLKFADRGGQKAKAFLILVGGLALLGLVLWLSLRGGAA
jgi:hypothetical protein